MSDLLITGIPRSGTTLTTALVDGLPNAICFNEPAWHANWVLDIYHKHGKLEADHFARWLIGEFAIMRRHLLAGKPVHDRRAKDGSAVTDYYRRKKSGGVDETYEIVTFTRPGLTGDFLQGAKHNGLYTGALQQILDTGFFPRVLVTLRHPVDVVLSWRSLEIPPSRGLLPGAAAFWPEMLALTKSEIDLLDRQVQMVELLFRRYWRLRDRVTILKYEELRQDPNLLCRALGLPETIPQSVIRPPYNKKAQENLEYGKVLACVRKHANYMHRFYEDLG